MNKNDRNKNIAAGYTIPARLLYDSARPDNGARKKNMYRDKCVYANEISVWICPDAATFKKYCDEIGYVPPSLPPSTLPPPQSVPLPPVVPPPPQSETPEPEPEKLEKPELKLIKEEAPTVAAKLEPASRISKAERRLLELPPCFIVPQTVGVQGDVRYLYSDEENKTEFEGETRLAKSKKTVEVIVRDPEEQIKAQQLAGQLRVEVRKLGSVLQSGVILVPTSREKELDKAIAFCREEAMKWNGQAKHHYIRCAVVKAAVTSDAESVAKDITFTLQETMSRLETALANCDTKQIKSIVDNAKPLTRVLPAKEANTLSAVISSAQATKKYIEEQVSKKRKQIEEVKREVARTQLGPVQTARAQYLELIGPVEMEVKPATVEERFDTLEGGAAPAPTRSAVNGDRFDL